MLFRSSHLVEHVSVFDAWRMSETPARMPGGRHFNYMDQIVTGQKQGLVKIYGAVQSQAMMLSLNSIYRTLACLMAIAVPLCLLLPRARGKPSSGAH